MTKQEIEQDIIKLEEERLVLLEFFSQCTGIKNKDGVPYSIIIDSMLSRNTESLSSCLNKLKRE